MNEGNAEALGMLMNISIGQHAACWAAIEALTATLIKGQPQLAALHAEHLQMTQAHRLQQLEEPQAREIANGLLEQLQLLTNTLKQ